MKDDFEAREDDGSFASIVVIYDAELNFAIALFNFGIRYNDGPV